MEYRDLYGTDPARFEHVFSRTATVLDRIEALISISLTEDVATIKGLVIRGLDDGEPSVREASVLAIDHMFRRFPDEDLSEFKSVLTKVSEHLGRMTEKVEDALETYQIYHVRD